MHIKQSVETENGTVLFEGELSEKEISFLLEFAINHLLMRGALPFVSSKDMASISPTTDTEQ